MRVLVGGARAEITVKGSRFIAETFSVKSQAEARETLLAQKARHRDASHVVHAFIAGKKAEVSGMSDDGEPGGTAGRPVLDVLRGSGTTDILLTVTRYFGGTLLGTGGLVRAYSEAAKAALLASETEEFVEKKHFTLECSYSDHGGISRIIKSHQVSGLSEDFSDAVRISGEINASESGELAAEVRNLTRGKSEIVIKD